jgi:hypothetical protein
MTLLDDLFVRWGEANAENFRTFVSKEDTATRPAAAPRSADSPPESVREAALRMQARQASAHRHLLEGLSLDQGDFDRMLAGVAG